MPLIERHGHDEIAALGEQWEALRRESSARSPFMTWAWIGSWLETAGSDADLEIVTARDPDSGRLLGVAPFYVASTRRGGVPVRELRVLGSGVTAPDHLDLILSNDARPEVADSLWAAVTANRRWHLLNLDGITARSHLSRVALRRRDDEATTLPCPYLPLEGGWEAVSGRLSSRLRKNLDRYGRKLERDADVRERMVTGHDDLDATFSHLVGFHQSIRTAAGDAGVFAHTDTRRFLLEAAHRFLETGRLRMWRLDADQQPIAVIWCVRADDSVAFYTTGYDAAWSKYGPGRHIMARAIRGAIDEGAKEFDFLRGDEQYKRDWGTEMRHDLQIRRPSAPRGRLLWFAGALARLTRSGRRHDG